ncbi:amino acid adenylation domain-containing protein [Planktothrix sp. FACHB-1355]|uniref:non-ribosomal peptide synthetase n=1 Tax=Planktothrix sp. FACHB-1355 TaxID=2692854 RepID=UPI00168B5FB1|nr:non-ribosomal peptide synthetase [Planktothrix sp. FACHB-1355]MBD3557353.1 amino acid adenylation domain-containing protein [Planktothrix sp. FACHB-1355]
MDDFVTRILNLPKPKKALLTRKLPPLSFSQRRFWFFEKFENRNALNNILLPVLIKGKLEIEIFEKSLNHVIKRHEILRTCFPVIEDEPLQLIVPELNFVFEKVDLSREHEQERDEEINKIIYQQAVVPFDLEKTPLLAGKIIVKNSDEHVILLTLHHIIFDGYSSALLINEVSTVYNSLLRDTEPVLPGLQLQYGDYARWQQDDKNAGKTEEHLRYWKSQLIGLPPLFQFPTDKPRPAHQEFIGDHENISLSSRTIDELKELARRRRASLFMILLAGFKALLTRYTNLTDIPIGCPVAGRNVPGTENLIGLFLNTLVMRTRFSPRATFSELLEKVRETVLNAQDHQNIPFEKIVEEIQPERSLSYAPIFQVLFSFQTFSGHSAGFSGLQFNMLDYETKSTQGFDLAVNLNESANGLVGSIEYDAGLFERETVVRFIRHYEQLLAAVIENPDIPIHQIDILRENEKRQLLVDWNGESCKTENAWFVHRMFESQAAQNPERIAAACLDKSLNYRELNENSNRIANFLIEKGFVPGSVGAILTDRNLDFLTSILGVLKTGGAYLPLDPSAPVERLKNIIAQSRPRVVLTTAELEKTAADLVNEDDSGAGRILRLDKIDGRGQTSNQNPGIEFDPQNLAYIIFTSGSTGKPKGVMLEHRGMSNNIRAKIADFELHAEDVVAETAPQFFDMSVWQFLTPLTVGGRVEIIPDDVLQNPHQFFPYIEKKKVSITDLVPSFLKMVLGEIPEAGDPDPAALRLLVTGGEALTPESVRCWFAVFPQIRLVNAYGPTEASDNITHYFINSPPEKDALHIPIGRPIRNTGAYVLGENFELMPIGCFGELFIGGECVARGYLNEPALTAGVFVPDPFSEIQGARMFRTGDVARVLPNGLIECVGRKDNQLKIRGFRIEPGEIENILLQHEAVLEAVVLAVADQNNGSNLVAYIVPGNDFPADRIRLAGELKTFLQKRLPYYMVPAFYVPVGQIPRTATGKLDRKALPAAETDRKEAKEARLAQLTPTEEILRAVWMEVLKIPHISEKDNFFDLGGHSLLATQVTSRIRKIWSLDIPLRDVFSVPDLRGLASKIDEHLAVNSPRNSAAHEIEKRSRVDRTPLSFSQQRLWFIENLEPQSSLYNILTAIRLKGAFNVETLNKAVNFIIRRQSSLRTVFDTIESRAFQKILPELEIELAVENEEAFTVTESEKKVKELIAEESRHCFDLRTAPLFRFRLLKTAPAEHLITLNMHHIVSDGWSMGIFIYEIAAVYEALAKEQHPELPELPVQYADYAFWQQDWMQSAEFSSQMNYWRAALADAPALIEMPTDRPRPSIQTFGGKRQQIEIKTEVVNSLKAAAGSEGATLFMVLLAGFYLLLHKYSDQQDILIGTPIAGRNKKETENLIGFFVNTLVLRVGLTSETTLGELIADVRRVCFDAYAHQDIPFEKLVEEINPERDLSYSPLFQIVFGLQNTPPQDFTVPELELEPVNFENGSSKYDITLFMNESGARLFGVLEYNPDLFDGETIEQILRHYENILSEISSQRTQTIAAVSMLTESEKAEVLGMGMSALNLNLSETVVETFERQAEKFPARTALVFEDRKMTYSELNRKANRLAHFLLSRTFTANPKIGLYMKRSADSVAAMLAVFKAGGVYVPLDPDYPPERLDFMIADANLSSVLTDSALEVDLDPESAELFGLREIEDDLPAFPDSNPTGRSGFSDIAYLIYTSGTSGQPKAVVIDHGNLAATMLYSQSRFRFEAADAMPCLASFSFDISLFEVLLPLLNGGTSVVFGKTEILEISAIVERLAEFTHLHAVPSLMRQIVEFVNRRDREGSRPEIKPLKQLFIGGDKVPGDLLAEMQKCFPHSDINILYGPTEGTIICSYYRLGQDEKLSAHLIGKPIGNNSLLILDRNLNPVPTGVPGELFLGGRSIARGYHNREALDAEKFILRGNERFYRTGDLTRFRRSGDIEFMGRIDDQVKIRGYRVELGEIESVLLENEAVQEAVVMAVSETRGEQTIAAYIVPAGGFAPTDEALREYLQSKLPTFMIPAFIYTVDKIPLTSNGKVDRVELRKMKSGSLESTILFAAPRTASERKIAEIWKEILKVEEIGIHHNFFSVGGHSLLLLQLREKLSKALARPISVIDLFRYPSIGAFADFLEENQNRQIENNDVNERSKLQRLALNRRKQKKTVRG